VDQHRFDAGPKPDQNFHVDADPTDPDPDSHQDDADPHADHTTNFTHVGQSDFFLLLVTALPVYNILSFSSVSEIA
jgi:hypothetical protein